MQIKLVGVRQGLLWKEIVKQKIFNQSKVLHLTNNDEKSRFQLKTYYEGVKRNDITNKEAIASRIYFNSIYGKEFIRFESDVQNNAINYFSTIIAAVIAKELVTYGIDTKIGIWHKSETNAFNLCYDLIEPYRPIIDYFNFYYKKKLRDPLSVDNRNRIISLLEVKIFHEGKMVKLQTSIKMLVKQYYSFLKEEKTELNFPEIMETNFEI